MDGGKMGNGFDVLCYVGRDGTIGNVLQYASLYYNIYEDKLYILEHYLSSS
jgi:hypothetical protein